MSQTSWKSMFVSKHKSAGGADSPVTASKPPKKSKQFSQPPRISNVPWFSPRITTVTVARCICFGVCGGLDWGPCNLQCLEMATGLYVLLAQFDEVRPFGRDLTSHLNLLSLLLWTAPPGCRSLSCCTARSHLRWAVAGGRRAVGCPSGSRAKFLKRTSVLSSVDTVFSGHWVSPCLTTFISNCCERRPWQWCVCGFDFKLSQLTQNLLSSVVRRCLTFDPCSYRLLPPREEQAEMFLTSKCATCFWL